MGSKRYRIPPLTFISGFEAAARTLSFTKAASELFVTQSAVSKQIKALEEHLGVVLFERRSRELKLTHEGEELYRVATDLLETLQVSIERIRNGGVSRHVGVTASTGFTSLWLIPRLKRFRRQHPRIDVRISASIEIVNLERSGLDVAIRYCKPDAAPADAIRVFDDVSFPVCSPALLADRSTPLAVPQDLRHHVLLDTSFSVGRKAYVDWESWLAAVGIYDLQPAGSLHFNQYEQMIQAAVDGQGVAIGINTLVQHLIQRGDLVPPFEASVAESRACYVIRSATATGKPHVDAFIGWLLEEAGSAGKAIAEVADCKSSAMLARVQPMQRTLRARVLPD